MKRLLLLLSCCFCLQCKAQQVIFAQDFEGFTPYQILGWGHQFSGAVPWQTGLPYLVGGACNNWPGNNLIAGICDCGTINYNNSNVFLISPYFNLANVNHAWLQYDSYFKGTSSGSFTELATLEISTDHANSWDTLQLVPKDTTPNMITYYFDLAPYLGMDSLKIGFRYNDGGGHSSGWEIDNIKIFKPISNDLEMLYVTPVDTMLSYCALNSSILHEGVVFNYSLDTITEFTATYKTGVGANHSYTFNNLQILPFSSYKFTHPIPDTVVNLGKQKVTMWVKTPGDGLATNDSAKTYINGVHFIPQKLLVLEEGTGTWNVWGPRGWVLMNAIYNNETNVCLVAAHNADPMAITSYSDFLYYKGYNFVPYFLLDRRINVIPDSLLAEINKEQQYFGFADLSLSSQITGSTLTVQINVTPAITLLGDYRLALMITEDSIKGNSAAYDQKNNFASGFYGPMGGFENMPDPVPASDMVYNFVARSVFPKPEGAFNSLPNYMSYPNTYAHTLSTTLSPNWHRNRLHGYVFLVNNADSTILNCKRIPMVLPVNDINDAQVNAGVYPNPANDWATVYFNLDKEERIDWSLTDITGKILLTNKLKCGVGYNEIHLPVQDLEIGIYFMVLHNESMQKTLKIQVLH